MENNKQQYLIQHVDTDSEDEGQSKPKQKKTVSPVYFPVPIQTEEIKLVCPDESNCKYSDMINNYLKSRLQFEQCHDLENWVNYYEALDTLYKSYSSIPTVNRIKYINIVGVNHKFAFQLRHDQEWYEIDLAFEYASCLVAGSVLLASHICTESLHKADITDTSVRQMTQTYAQVTLNLFVLLDSKNLTYTIRNKYLPSTLHQYTLHCYSTVFYAIAQLQGIFQCLKKINIGASVITTRSLKLNGNVKDEVVISYDEIVLSEEVMKHFDKTLSYYMGLFTVRNMYVKAFKYLNAIKLMLPDIVFKYVNKKMDEVKLNMRALINFVPKIKKDSNQVSKLSALSKDYEILNRLFPSIEFEKVTLELMDVIRVQKTVVEKRSKQLIYTLIENHAISVVKDITHYISNEEIKAKFAF